MLDSIKKRFRAADGSFVRNIGWLGGSGAIIRISRLVATIVLARFLTKYDYGLAALVLTTNEFVSVFTRNGVVIHLVRTEAENVEELARAAYWFNWAMFGGLFLLQCLVAFLIARFYSDNRIILPICAMGLNLLFIPLGLVQAALIQREGRFKAIALSDLVQVSTDNLLSGILAIAGWGMWAIILPKIIVAPIWVYFMRANHPWRPTGKFSTARWGELFGFGRSVLGVELLNKLRSNLDYLLVGRFLGVGALGVYYFAFNAGLGISLGIITSIKSALLPHLCDVRGDREKFQARYLGSLKTAALAIVPLVLLQSLLAPVYVPLVFGQKWIPAIPILILICLSAIPRPFADAASQLLLAIGKPEIDLVWNLIFTGLFSIALFIGVHWQSVGVAAAVFLSHAIFLPLFTLWASRYVFRLQESGGKNK